jgi:hypothetical protein
MIISAFCGNADFLKPKIRNSKILNAFKKEKL